MRYYFKKNITWILVFALLVSGFGFGAFYDKEYSSAAIRLSKKKITVSIGSKVKLKLKGAPVKKVRWKTKNRKIAIVGKRGVVRGKSQGKTKVFARYKGKKYVCKVVVTNLKTNSSGEVISTDPSSTRKPKNNNSGGEASVDSTAKPKATDAGGSSTNSGSSSVPADEGTSSKEVPSSAAANTLQLGSATAGKSITLGEAADGLSAKLGTPVRIDKAMQGFDLYIYNPSGDYNNYFQVYVENGVVAGFITISSYFAYDSLVKSNDTTDTLSKNGFTSETSSKSSRGYKKEISVNGTGYNVIAYIDRYGGSLRDTATNKVFGLQVYPSTYDNDTMFQDGASYTTTCTESNGVYVNQGANSELAELINAYRVFKGKKAYMLGEVLPNAEINEMDIQKLIANFAQIAAEKMATANSEIIETAEEKKDRFETYTHFTVGEYAEVDTVKSADPMDALKTFLFGSLASTDTAANILSDSYICMICGFGYKSSTYFVVDVWN